MLALLSAAPLTLAQVPTEVQLPGTQPLQVQTLQSPTSCSICHGGYDSAVEPYHNWQGGMMAHAARDPVFWATVAITEQGFPGAGDFCIRCHTPTGWIDGRSIPTNGSALSPGSDADGITCATCHRLTNPNGSEFAGVQTPPFVANDGGMPANGYHGNGMYVLWNGAELLGPYLNTAAFHPASQSLLHRDSQLCGTCHDVSNPVVGDLAPNNGHSIPLTPGTFSGTLGTPVQTKAAFNNMPHQYGTADRTFSEHQSSAFRNLPVGAYPGLPSELKQGAIKDAYDAATVANPMGNYEDGTLRTYSCQTCHMPPVTGYGDAFSAGPLRKDLPRHSLTGGNYWTPQAIQYLDPLGKLVLGGGITPEQNAAMDDAIERSKGNLEAAAALEVVGQTVRVINLTGHKLITGYPEGRRMWLRIEWQNAAGSVVRVDGEYGPINVQVGGNPISVDTLIDLHDPNTHSYEAHHGVTQEWATKLIAMGSSPSLPLDYDRVTGNVNLTLGILAAMPPGTVAETFHFVLNNTIVSDTRIPPYGFDYDEAAVRDALPVPATQYGNPGVGGTYDYFDSLTLNPPVGAVHAKIDLLYQPTSWEYIQFLLLANDGTDPFLGSTGQNIYEAWLNTDMAAPHVMTSATWTDPNHPWVDLGGGVAGAAGIPHLYGAGTLQVGAPMTLALNSAAPNSNAYLVIGFSRVDLPFYGGVLFPSPDVVLPNLPVNAAGELTLATPWPSGLPSGTQLYFQYLIADAAGLYGVAQSNGVEATLP